jgi:hypothetical protein
VPKVPNAPNVLARAGLLDAASGFPDAKSAVLKRGVRPDGTKQIVGA